MKQIMRFYHMMIMVFVLLIFGAVSVQAGPCELPEFDPANFTDPLTIDNPYWPLFPGTIFVYEPVPNEDDVINTVEVTDETKSVTINGDTIECRVVYDVEEEDGLVTEETWDWYAQDKWGNVWYMGEDTAEYEDGKLLNHEGAWDPDKDGSLPGIIMWSNPIPGTTYRQEYLKGEAEDMATVISIGTDETIGYGTYSDVLVTKDFVPDDPEGTAYKYYAPGVGVFLEKEGDERVELIEFIPATG